MKKQFGHYRRLVRGMMSCSSLWLGPDHLVYVKGSGCLIPFTEEYKRFRFRDIQAVTYARTRMFALTSWFYGMGAAASAALIFLPTYAPGAQVTVAVLLLPVLAVCLPGFIITVLRGPSCRCRIQTGVGSVVIRPLSRVRQAEPAIREMIARISEHQEAYFGDAPLLDPDAVAAPGPDADALAAARAAASPSAGARPKRALKFSRLLLPTFAGMIPFGLLFLVQAYTLEAWPLILLVVLSVILFGGSIASLVAQFRCITPKSILTVLWTALVQQIVLMIVAYVFYTIRSLTPEFEEAGVLPFSVSDLYGDPQLGGYVYYFSIFNGFLSLFLGLAGISLVMRHRSRAAKTMEPPDLPKPVAGTGAPGGLPRPEEKETIEWPKRIDDER